MAVIADRATDVLPAESSGAVILAASGTALGLIGLLGLACFGTGPTTYGPTLAGMGLSLLSLAAKAHPAIGGRIARRVASYTLLMPALAAALLVTQAAVREPEYENYGWWVLLWAGALTCVVGAAGAYDSPAGLRALRALPRRVALAAGANRREGVLLLGIVAAAAVLRVIALDELPSPFSGDEAAHAIWSRGVTDGRIANPFESGLQGQPNAYYFALAGLTKLSGFDVASLRLLGVIVGLASIVATYAFLRVAFGRRAAVVGGVYMAAHHAALHYSRVSLNNIGEALSLAALAFFLYQALATGRALYFALTGVTCGLAIYTSAGGRMALPIVAVVMVVVAAAERRRWRTFVAGMPFLAVGALVAGLPLGWWWFENPDEFMNRLDAIGIYQSGWMDRELEQTGQSEVSILMDQARYAFGGWVHYPDVSHHYHASIPLIERWSVPFFVAGAVVALTRFWRPGYAIPIATLCGITIAGGVLTQSPPTSQRLVGALPAAVAFTVIGLEAVAGGLVRLRPRIQFPAFVPGALVILIAGGLAWANGWYYFETYREEDRYSDATTRLVVEIGDYVDTLPEEMPLVMHGEPVLFHGHPTLAYILLGRPGYSVLGDGSYRPALPADLPAAVHIVLPDRTAELEELMSSCPGGTAHEDQGQGDRVEFYAYTLEAPCPEWLEAHRPGSQ